jgi:hypothetical protein
LQEDIMTYILTLAALIAALTLPSTALSDWDYSRRSIDIDQIQSGGPPRDGIPALFEPKTLPAKWVDFLDDNDQVLGVVHNGIARAYPTRILSWHELVNDDFGGDPLLVSW